MLLIYMRMCVCVQRKMVSWRLFPFSTIYMLSKSFIILHPRFDNSADFKHGKSTMVQSIMCESYTLDHVVNTYTHNRQQQCYNDDDGNSIAASAQFSVGFPFFCSLHVFWYFSFCHHHTPSLQKLCIHNTEPVIDVLREILCVL